MKEAFAKRTKAEFFLEWRLREAISPHMGKESDATPLKNCIIEKVGRVFNVINSDEIYVEAYSDDRDEDILDFVFTIDVS